MIKFCKLKSFEIVKGERIVKVEQYGTKTADFCTSFGDDSVALPEMTALYVDTGMDGDKVVIGYINKGQLSKVQPGEKRIFSVKGDGSLSTEIYLRKDEKIEIGGNTDNLVKFTPLEAALMEQIQKINTELTAIALGITAAGGSYTPTPISVNFNPAKSEKLLCE
jgi:hypothetical protein